MRSVTKTVLVVLVISTVLVYYLSGQRKKAADFRLVNWDGRTISMSALRGKTVALTFSYSNCSARCPVVTVRLSSLDERLEAPEDIVYLHVSVDPEKDTPESMKKYFSLYKLDAQQDRRWIFVSGPRNELAEIWKSYGIEIEKIEENRLPEGYYMEYTPKLVLIDKDGYVRHEEDFFFDEEEIAGRIREII